MFSLSIYIKYENETLTFISFLIYGLFFLIYFLIPLMNNPFVLYVIMVILIDLDMLVDQRINLFLFLLLLLLAVESTERLGQIFNYFLLGFIITSVVGLLFIHNQLNWPWIFFVLILIYPFVKLNQMHETEQERIDTYEKLLGEYRKLKRQALDSERAARLEERTKIARDIHDSVGHKLTALLMRIQMLIMNEEKKEYVELKELAAESLEETRQAVKQLQIKDNEGISSVLQLIRKLESESHIHLDFTLRKGVLSARLTNQQNVVLYRVLQESLTNAMRHAKTKEVKAELALNAVGDLTFTIRNRIWNMEKFEWGFGLTNMKKRVEEAGGQLSVYQHENEFIVSGTLPVEGTA
jgi:signal transduction histidine kinase